MISAWLSRLFAKAFAPLPEEPIHQWAESSVWISKKHGAEEGYYRSAKTPWTRWLQEIARHPWRMRKGKLVRIRRVRVRKCTQSGFTESILNIIRWCAKFSPRNFLYAINSKEEAINIRERLVDTLTRLGEEIFAIETDADDLGKLTLRLREMVGWFIGSFSPGAFANKYAPLVVVDEYDDHAVIANVASTLDLADERNKTADADGLSIALGKPKLAGGPIDKEHDAGDTFLWWVPCPHCNTYQSLVWERVRFSDCRDLLGVWDLERILSETYYECASSDACRILDDHKPWMEERGRWVAASYGDPETVSLSMTDLHSMDKGSTFGIIAKEFVKASIAAETGNIKPMQAWENGRMGKGHEQRVEKFSLTDILKCRGAYKRGTVPRAGLLLAVGMDIGLFANNRWVVLALDPATVEAWLIDYGTARGPADLLELMRRTYDCPAAGRRIGIGLAFVDCRYRREEVYAVALQHPRRIYPTLGLKPGIAARSVAFTQIPDKPIGFGVITYIDQDVKYAFYVDRIKHQRQPRMHVPIDAEDKFLLEFTTERMIRDPVTGRVSFAEKPSGPNHGADATKICITGYDFLIDGPLSRVGGEAPAPPVEALTIAGEQ